jgi:hypothetical protein
MTDFDIFFQAARTWASGGKPDWFYPFPTLFLFLPFLAFPLSVAKALWFALSLAAVVAVFKRFSLLAVFYVPLLQCLFLGQLDVIFLPLVALTACRERSRMGGPVGLALLTLKPQLVWLYLPIWIWSLVISHLPALVVRRGSFAIDEGQRTNDQRQRTKDKGQIIIFLTVSGLLWGLPLLIWPDYLAHWQSRDPSQAAFASPSLWGGGYLHLGVILVTGAWLIIKVAQTPKEKWVAATAANPFLNIYNLVILLPLAGKWSRLALVLLSWPVFWLTNQVGTAWPGIILTLAVLSGPAGSRLVASGVARWGFLAGAKGTGPD